MTLAEINKTVLEKRQPQGSKINGRVIEVDCQEISFHEIKMILFSENKYIAVIKGIGNKDHKSFLEIIEK